jgi:dolichyl-phosphate-mannose-protein mannosyltransferase
VTSSQSHNAASWPVVVVTGVLIGIVYALSPLTALCAVAMAFLIRGAAVGIEGDERKWLLIVLVGAVALRVAAVAGLFAVTDHARVPFGSFFGDEEYFIKRAIWLRNVGSGVPIHVADLIYAFDQYSDTSYLYVLAFLQALVGSAPYGVHLVGMAFYMGGVVLLYRLTRQSLGRMPAFIGLLLLLALPTLFAWSISALKDPLFFLLSASSLVAAVRLVRATGWRQRALAAITIGLVAAAIATIRQGGGVLIGLSIATGLAVAALVARPRLLLATLMATPIVAGLALSRPDLQLKVYQGVQAAAGQHWGHVWTAGWVYHTLDDRFYAATVDGVTRPDRAFIRDMQFREAGRFIVRALERYVTVPLPWEARSAAALAYLPEQLVWYLLVAFAPFGVIWGFRRSVLVTSMLSGYAAVAAVMVAFISGNVGTVVRHRGLALPYIVWLSAVGACELVSRLRGRERVPTRPGGESEPILPLELIWR